MRTQNEYQMTTLTVRQLARYDQYPDGTFAMYFDLGNGEFTSLVPVSVF